MTLISKRVVRETMATITERSRRRAVIVSIEPPNLIGLRLKGTRRTYRLTTDQAYMIALRAELRAAEREKGKTRRR